MIGLCVIEIPIYLDDFKPCGTLILFIGIYGKRWVSVETLIGSWQHVKILIKAVRGISYKDGLAIDDVSLSGCALPTKPAAGLCKSSEFTCSDGGCIPQELMCDYANDCSNGGDEQASICNGYYGRCDFDHGLCVTEWGWKVVDGGTWQTSCPSHGDIPSYDHNMNKGKGFITS